MDIVSLIITSSVGITFLVWLMRSHDWHSLIAIAPYCFLVLVVLQLNYDAQITIPFTSLGCGTNGDSTGWIYGCIWLDTTLEIDLDPQMLTLLNVMMMLGIIILSFVAYEHTTTTRNKNKMH